VSHVHVMCGSATKNVYSFCVGTVSLNHASSVFQKVTNEHVPLIVQFECCFHYKTLSLSDKSLERVNRTDECTAGKFSQKSYRAVVTCFDFK
jgi:hypothetical protein